MEVMKSAQVVGMTTTKAASCRTLLDDLNASVVIVEEAGEVLEAHVLTSVNRNAKHLILIGDHKQVRLKVEIYQHSEKFHQVKLTRDFQ